MKDLIERLRIVAKYHRTDRQASDDAVILEAADAIERLSLASNEEFPALVLSVALSATDMQVIHTYLGAHAIQAQAPLKEENAQLKAELAAMRAAPIFGFHWRRGWEWGFSLTGDFNASDKSSFTPLYAAPGAKP